MNASRKNAVKPTPQIVAVFFVSRFTQAVLKRIRKTATIPIGNSHDPCRVCLLTLSGTLYCRGDRIRKRSTAIASDMNTNDQTTPKAYASPSVLTSPRLARMTTICATPTRLMIRLVVPISFVRLLKPGREHAVFRQAIQHAVRTDQAGIDGPGEDQESDDHDETFHDDLDPRRPDEVMNQSVDQVVAVSAVVALDMLPLRDR